MSLQSPVSAMLSMLQTIVSESCRDICPILKDAAALKAVIDLFEEHVRNNHQHVDLIVGKKNKSRALKLLCFTF